MFTNKNNLKYNICTYIQHIVNGTSKHTYFHIFNYIHWKLCTICMLADIILLSHMKTPCLLWLLTKLTSNVIIDKFDITKKNYIPSKIRIFHRSNWSGQDLIKFNYSWIYCMIYKFNISGTFFCISISDKEIKIRSTCRYFVVNSYLENVGVYQRH